MVLILFHFHSIFHFYLCPPGMMLDLPLSDGARWRFISILPLDGTNSLFSLKNCTHGVALY